MQITVDATVRAPVAVVWSAYTTPADIVEWNAASDDWHTTEASVGLREGGAFRSRMEARDGSMGFDFEGTYTQVVERELIAYAFGGRTAEVVFSEDGDVTQVTITFDAETENPVELQRAGWQAILDRFAAYVEHRSA